MFGSSVRNKILDEERLLGREFRGVVDGVIFDLRHKKVDRRRWSLPSLISSPPGGHPGFYVDKPIGSAGPFGDALSQIAGQLLEQAVARGMHIVRPGDCVRARDAFVFAENDPLKLSPDREIAVLLLEIARSSGEVENAKPLILTRKGRLAEGWSERETLERFADRHAVLAENGVDVSQLEKLAGDVAELRRQTESLLRQNGAPEAEEGLLSGLMTFAFGAYDLERLVNLAALYGYEQAKAEASVTALPVALGAVKRRQTVGQKVAEANRRRREAWEPDAKRMAWAMWRENPNLPATTVAEAIDENVSDAPKREQILKYVRTWRREDLSETD